MERDFARRNLLAVAMSSEKIVYNSISIRKLFWTEEKKFSGKQFCSVFESIIDQIISGIQMFIMRKNQSFISKIGKMFMDPGYLVWSCTRIVPRSGREEIGIEVFWEKSKCFKGSGHRIHETKDTRNVSDVMRILQSGKKRDTINSALKVYQYSIHIDIKNFFHSRKRKKK